MNTLILFTLVTLSLYSYAEANELCDKNSPIDIHQITTPGGDFEATVCQQGEDVLILSDRPIERNHLIYAGLNIGMPWLLGAGLTYSQLRQGRQQFHIAANLDGSLGGNGISAEYGQHPFGNSIYYGGLVRGYKGLPGEGGFQMGPMVGISGGKRAITGHISVGFLGGYDSRVGGAQFSPEISMGLRIRLFKK